MNRECLGAIAAVLATVAQPLLAQGTRLQLGQRVRVMSSADSSRHEGQLILAVGDTVVLQRDRDQDWYVVRGRDRLEVSTHRRSRPLLGAVVGAAFGAAVGYISYGANGMVSCSDIYSCPPPTHQLLGQGARTAIGGLVGLGLGALAGTHVYTRVWEPVPQAAITVLESEPRVEGRPQLPYGEWVRLTSASDGSRHEGRLVLGAADTVVLERGHQREWLRLGSGDRMEVRTSVRSRLLLGAAAGGALGAALGSTSRRHPCEASGIIIGETVTPTCGLNSFTGALVFGGAGMAVGALIGSQIRETEWALLSPERTRLMIAPLRDGGMVVGASLEF